MASYGPYISKIVLPNGTTYDIKDQEARDLIASIVAGGLQFKVSATAADTPAGIVWEEDGQQITGVLAASGETKAFIYLVPNRKTSGDVDFYREYVTVNFGTESAPAWAWEFLGDTDIDLSGLGQLAWKNSASGSTTVSTADAGTFTNGVVNANATYTPAGSVNVTLSQTATAASLTKSSYTPEGTVSAPTITVTPIVDTVKVAASPGAVTAGTAASFTQGKDTYVAGSKAADSYTAPTLTTTVNSETETLTIGWNSGSFTEGAYTPGTFTQGSDTFSTNTPTGVTLPTFTSQDVATGIASATSTAPAFSGTLAENILVTGVNYDKAGVASQTFSGTQATISSTGTASGDVTLTKTDKTITVVVE